MPIAPQKLLFICGSLNQTTQMHQIARELPEYRHAFTPYYGNRDFDLARSLGALESTIGGHKLGRRCIEYLRDHDLPFEQGGALDDFDLAFHCSDLVWPENLTRRPVVLVQEGMIDPPAPLLPLVSRVDAMPRWLAGTSALGLSRRYARFCVASEGFADEFVERGCDRSRLVVTGIPNFDQCHRYAINDFPFRGYVLAATSDVRETFGREDRRTFLENAARIARDRHRELIVKLHPNEDVTRAVREARAWVPHARVYATGCAEEMVANCSTLVASYSSLALVALALGKEVHSAFDRSKLERLIPLQNGRAAKNIANVARELLGASEASAPGPVSSRRSKANGTQLERREVLA